MSTSAKKRGKLRVDTDIDEGDQIASLIINLLAEDPKKILYRPRFARMTGGVLSAILLQQVIYHCQKYDPFYKFISSCSHPLYRKDDSWCEELNYTVSEFRTAISKVGIKITKGTSKNEVLSECEPLWDDKGNLLNSNKLILYWTDAGRVTWYSLNRNLLGKCLQKVYLGKLQIPNYLNNDNSLDSSYTEITSKNTTKNTSSSSPS